MLQVLDRLQKVGVCLSYEVGLKLQEHIGKHFMDDLIDAVQKGKR